MNWRQRGSLWCLKPADPLGCVAFIGGSYLAATPQLSYRRLLEAIRDDRYDFDAAETMDVIGCETLPIREEA